VDGAQPAHGIVRCETVVLRHVERDERARAAQPRLAVHRQRPGDALGDDSELAHDMGRRGGAVLKGEVCDGDIPGAEGRLVVFGRVEPHNCLRTHGPAR
jgi:hypothetical protein